MASPQISASQASTLSEGLAYKTSARHTTFHVLLTARVAVAVVVVASGHMLPLGPPTFPQTHALNMLDFRAVDNGI